jgi:glycosyltransferase involved in cell wall biosynthesis
MLLDALVRIRGEFAVSLTIIGDGPLRDDLEKQVREKGLGDLVHLAGAKSLSEIAEYLREAHVFCLPSVRESGGAALMESLAAGIPALGVNYGGPAEIIDDSVGRLLSAEGPEQLIGDMVAAFRDIMTNPVRWKQRGEAGRRRAEQQYGWEARIDAAMAIYGEMLAGQETYA